MTPENAQTRVALRLHLTNVAGTGATQLLQSLLPALERNAGVYIDNIYLPDRGDLANYQKSPSSRHSECYRRRLPNALSRLLECVVFAHRFDGDEPLLVFGDLPLRCRTHQTVFVQTPHLVRPARSRWSLDEVKFAISRKVFCLNAPFAKAFIVQTEVMRKALAARYPDIAEKIHVIAQPVPFWLLASEHRPNKPFAMSRAGLRLIYPAAGYPHKNHKLLADIKSKADLSWPIENFLLTIPAEKNPAPDISWIKCVGFMNPPEMIQAYRDADALLFLSTDESYGFPLVEAMSMGLPIVCPDLPYAHALCADTAIYFDPFSIDSLHHAIEILYERLLAGWRPDWTAQLNRIPKDWDAVAEAMINVVFGSRGS